MKVLATDIVENTINATLNRDVLPAVDGLHGTPGKGIAALLLLGRLSGRPYDRITEEGVASACHSDVTYLMEEVWQVMDPVHRNVYGPVMAMPSYVASDYQRVCVGDLPTPHNLGDVCGWTAVAPTEFIDGLQAGTRRPCHRHHTTGDPPRTLTVEDWRLAVNLAEQVVHRHTPALPASHILMQLRGPRDGWESGGVEHLALSLVNDPIRWTPGDTELSGGQHRVCGARTVGVDKLLVQTTYSRQ